MTAPTVHTDLALLVDVGSAWAKAGVIGRVRGRWRLVAHAAQPTAWGPSELRQALVDQLRASADPRITDRLDDLLAGANRIECHTAQRPVRLAIVAGMALVASLLALALSGYTFWRGWGLMHGFAANPQLRSYFSTLLDKGIQAEMSKDFSAALAAYELIPAPSEGGDAEA